MGVASEAAPARVPFTIITGGNGAAFDVASSQFVAPALGFYNFGYTILLLNISPDLLDVYASLAVDGVPLTNTTCTVAPGASRTLTSNALLQLLPDQRVAVVVDSVGIQIRGSTAGAPPYPTVFSCFSLF
jgi:hypothetical protein